ncbi:antitoxin of toxin-antitoxin stability system [Limosilactobacillus reuteri]|uniref:Antitoxin of toxin-antitoxin stability system n=1 Tax=Limosilactobacillus reuteri TaxID=1598 RepID=A0A855XJX2_LIMRT|nr:antitoxin of toxin-antitoxin stability system [Limosilactobacillus reuteri]PWT39088.1 antitoxin of toxin-antitoxin stability system [Limosilactobacillus reuteri]
MTVKMRKVGTSNVLTVPKNIPETSKEYDVYAGRDGAIVYLPKKKNLFKDKEYLAHHKYDGNDTGFIDAEVLDDELQ